MRYIVVVAAGLLFTVAGFMSGQEPECPALPPVPEQKPRPIKGAGSVADFVENVSKNDAIMEVIVGQSRILTTKADLAVAGQRARVAVGDPTVVDFAVLNARQIRVVGTRIGVTDLSITTGKNETYTFEIRVVADLCILQVQLKKSFPEANIRLSQIRDHVILEGDARDVFQRAQIEDTVKAYLDSVAIGQARKTSSKVEPDKLKPPVKKEKDDKDKEKDDAPEAPPEKQAGTMEAKIAPPQVINLLRVPGVDYAAVLEQHLKKLYPDACVTVSVVGGSFALEGQARDAAQVRHIVETARAYLGQIIANQAAVLKALKDKENRAREDRGEEGAPSASATISFGGPQQQQQQIIPPIINLLRVPGTRQVMLKVKVAELNRTALRQMGTDLLFSPGKNLIGTNIGNNTVNASVTGLKRMLTGTSTLATGPGTTVFGVFENADFAVFFSALRRNSILKILAEPNLVALNGNKANFLAGGQFPVPVSQASIGGVAPTITVEFHDFGVNLDFLPHILDGEIIRLAVDSEVSTVDFTLGTVLVPGGSPVPGLNIRRAHTVVEMKEGQTLAIAGLLSVTLDGTTSRIPGLGDLPVLGAFFSNTTGNRIEKELIVLVTPHLVEPMRCDQVGPAPGDEVNEPNDLERYLMMRIEGRTGRDHRSTVNYECQLPALRSLMRMESANMRGPYGFCE